MLQMRRESSDRRPARHAPKKEKIAEKPKKTTDRDRIEGAIRALMARGEISEFRRHKRSEAAGFTIRTSPPVRVFSIHIANRARRKGECLRSHEKSTICLSAGRHASEDTLALAIYEEIEAYILKDLGALFRRESRKAKEAFEREHRERQGALQLRIRALSSQKIGDESENLVGQALGILASRGAVHSYQQTVKRDPLDRSGVDWRIYLASDLRQRVDIQVKHSRNSVRRHEKRHGKDIPCIIAPLGTQPELLAAQILETIATVEFKRTFGASLDRVTS